MTMYELTDAEARAIERRRRQRKSAPAWPAWIMWGLLCTALLVATASVFSVYGPGIIAMVGSGFTPAAQPTAVLPTPRPAPTVAPVLAAPPIIVQQQPAQPQPQIVVPPPAPVAPDQPTPQPPQVVYVMTQDGAPVSTGSGTNDAQGGASTGVCALGKGARRCGR